MRALAADTLRALQAPLPHLAPDWTSGLRTGDTASGERAAQDRRLPTLLVTTPESVSLLLARGDAHERLRHVQLVVVDEWHELVGNKRGVQTQLALARLSGWNPALQVWGMSATLGNLQEALDTLLPRPATGARPMPPPRASAGPHRQSAERASNASRQGRPFCVGRAHGPGAAAAGGAVD